MLVELLVVLLGRRHHVGLVLQGALAEGEPDRREVLLLTAQPHVPPALTRLAAIDGDEDRVLVELSLEPLVDLRLDRVELGIGRRVMQRHEHSTSAPTVRSA